MTENNTNRFNQVLLVIVVIMFLGILGITAYFIYQNFQLQQQLIRLKTNNQTEIASETEDTTANTNQPTPVIEPTEIPTNTPDPYQDWETYTNQEYGFQISYPNNYQALDDENNLYGWPDAIVLLYKGGQAYDLPVEIWDTEAEYQQKYGSRLDEIVVKEVNGKYITFLDNTTDDNFDKIVNSFKKI